MTPQSDFMVLGTINPEREAELRRLLESMNDAPGHVNPNNALIPFGQFDTVHVARFVILKDNSPDDVRAYGLPRRDYPLYLAFLGNVDGDAETFLEDVARRASPGLRAIFSCCKGFKSETDLAGWMKRNSRFPAAAYTNWRGRTVRRVREDAALHDALEKVPAEQYSCLRRPVAEGDPRCLAALRRCREIRRAPHAFQGEPDPAEMVHR